MVAEAEAEAVDAAKTEVVDVAKAEVVDAAEAEAAKAAEVEGCIRGGGMHQERQNVLEEHGGGQS
jgi:hypothetical protein